MSTTRKTDFDFYVKCGKPLLLSLPDGNDRILAAAWLKRLVEESAASTELRTNYIKLLLYFLQKRKLGGPFCEHPDSFDTLAEFPEDQNLFESSRNASKKRPEDSEQPYILDFSGDLRTYVAYQNIENLGTQCYYAMSKNPLTTWEGFEKSIFPIGVTPADFVYGFDDEIRPKNEVKDPELEQKKYDFAEKLQKKIEAENKRIISPVTPIGTQPNTNDDIRRPPSWGSNLILVKDIDGD